MQLNESGLARFSDSLRAAIMARVPLPWDRFRVDLYDQIVRTLMSQGLSVTQIAHTHTELPIRYRAALNVYQITGAFDLVLAGLTAKELARQTLARVVIRTLIYLGVLLFIGSVLLSFFDQFLSPQIQMVRADLMLLPAVNAQHLDTTALFPLLMVIFSIGWSILFTIVATGCAASLTLPFGGRGFQTSSESEAVLRIADRIAARRIPADESVVIASDLVGASLRVRQYVMESMGVGVGPTGRTIGISGIADHCQSAATDRLATLRVLLPTILIIVIGGSASMAYCIAMFWPIVAILKDLSLPGLQT